ncbi:MAG: hypothetical protein ACRC10_09460 [Thermoguttaceae bacterium]
MTSRVITRKGWYVPLMIGVVLLCFGSLRADLLSQNISTGSETYWKNGYELDQNWTVAYLGGLDLGAEPGIHPSLSVFEASLNGAEPLEFEETWVLPDSHWPLSLSESSTWGQLDSEWARWIVPLSFRDVIAELDNPAYPLSHIPGYYAYKMDVDTDWDSARILGLLASDNDIMGVMFNGNWLELLTVPNEREFDVRYQLDETLIGGSDFSNELIVIVSNFSGPVYGNPTGLWLGGIVRINPEPINEVPEPGSLLLMSCFGLTFFSCKVLGRKRT